MSDDLVRRLKRAEGIGACLSGDARHVKNLCSEAASAIEAKDAENAALKHDLERYMTIANTECERAEQAERALAEAVDVLRPFAQFDHATISDHPDKCIIARGRVPSVLTLSQFESARQFVKEHGKP